MMTALRADIEILLKVERMNEVSAVAALCPEIVWHAVELAAISLKFRFFENTHVELL